jgi:hypothetical protein
MKQISLTRGLVALVDDGDYEWLSKWSWYADKSHKNKWRAARKPDKIIYMHRVITEAAPKEIVDHIDGDPLNNQRKNSRNTLPFCIYKISLNNLLINLIQEVFPLKQLYGKSIRQNCTFFYHDDAIFYGI